MTWLRLVALAFSGILLLFLLLLGLVLFTSQGNQIIWQQAQRLLPGLHGELVAGHLGSGWEFKGLGFSHPQFSFDSEHIKLSWQAGGLLSGHLVIDELSLDKLVISVLPSHPDASSEPEEKTAADVAPSFFRMPLWIELKRLDVSHFLLKTPAVDVTVGELQAAASWQEESVQLLSSHASGVDVHLLPNSGAVASAPVTFKATAAQLKSLSARPFDEKAIKNAIETLPTFFLPIRLDVQQFSVDSARYHQDGFDTGLFDISELAGKFAGEELNVASLRVSHGLGDLALNGRMQFHDYYPMEFILDGQSRLPWVEGALKDRKASLHIKGSLTDLHSELKLVGKEEVRLMARLNTLAIDLPFELEGQWNGLQWPLQGKAEYQLLGGKAKANGTLNKYRLQLDTRAKALDFPAGKVAISLDGSLQGIRFNPLVISSGATELEIAGDLSWHKSLKWQGRVKGHSANIHEWTSAISGRLAGQVDTRFELKEKHWSLSLPVIDIKGQLNGYPLSMRGEVQGNDKLHWTFKKVQLHSGANQLSMDGSLSDRWALNGKLDAPELGIFYSSLSGDINSTFSLSGKASAPQIDWTIAAERLGFDSLRFRDVKSEGSLRLDKIWSGEGKLQVGRIRDSSLRLQDLSLKVSGDERKHQLILSFAGKPVAMQLQLQGALQKGRWQLAIDKNVISSPVGTWTLAQPLVVTSRAPWREVSLERGCWHSEKAQLCLGAGVLGESSGELPLSLTDFATERLHPFLPERFVWNSLMAVTGKVGWLKGIPRLELSVQTDAGELKADEIVSRYDLFTIKIQLDEKSGNFLLDFASSELGKANIDVHIDDPQQRRQLSGNISLSNLRLYGIAPLFDELRRTKGRIDAKGKLAGDLDKPLFFGSVQLSEGEVDTSAEIANLRQIVSVLQINGSRADLDGSMMVGKGKLRLGGYLDWGTGSPQGRLTLDADTLEVGLAGYGRARVSANLVSTIGDELNLQGRVFIPWARIKVKELPDSVVAVSDDVEIVTPRKKEQPKTVPVPLWLDLSISLGGDVQLDAFGLKTKLVGGINMTQSPEKPLRTDGEIRLDDGRFKAYGQNLLIEEGSLLFSGNVAEPYLKITAERDPETMEDKSVTVGVKVTGPASQPRIEIYSEPQLSETEKLSYLLRGKGTGSGVSSSGDDAMAGLLLGAGLSQAGGVVSGVVEAFGFSDVSVDSKGSGDDTQVTISGYIVPKLQLQYGVGVFTAINEVTLRYELVPRLYLQAMTGLSQAIDIFYKFEF